MQDDSTSREAKPKPGKPTRRPDGTWEFQMEVCEYSDDPFNREHPICGKPATCVIFGPPVYKGDSGEFPLCKKHFNVMTKDIATSPEMTQEEYEQKLRSLGLEPCDP